MLNQLYINDSFWQFSVWFCQQYLIPMIVSSSWCIEAIFAVGKMPVWPMLQYATVCLPSDHSLWGHLSLVITWAQQTGGDQFSDEAAHNQMTVMCVGVCMCLTALICVYVYVHRPVYCPYMYSNGNLNVWKCTWSTHVCPYEWTSAYCLIEKVLQKCLLLSGNYFWNEKEVRHTTLKTCYIKEYALL